MTPDVTNFYEQINIFVTSVTALVLCEARGRRAHSHCYTEDAESSDTNKIRNNHSVQVIWNIRFLLAESDVILRPCSYSLFRLSRLINRYKTLTMH